MIQDSGERSPFAHALHELLHNLEAKSFESWVQWQNPHDHIGSPVTAAQVKGWCNDEAMPTAYQLSRIIGFLNMVTGFGPRDQEIIDRFFAVLGRSITKSTPFGRGLKKSEIPVATLAQHVLLEHHRVVDMLMLVPVGKWPELFEAIGRLNSSE